MNRQIVGSVVLVLTLVGTASAQVRRGNFGGSGFGVPGAGMGNAGSFATGQGFSNGTANSNNFGATAFGGYNNNFQAMAPGVMQSIPGVSNFGSNFQSSISAGMPAIGYGSNMGFNPFVPGIAPPGFTKDMFGYDVGIGGESGYTDFGSAVTASALGLGFGGMGYGGMGFGPMGFSPMGYTYPGMVPGTFIPGVGYASPVDIAAAASMNGGMVPNQGALPARPGTTKPGATIEDQNDNGNASSSDPATGNANANRRPGVRRSFLNDNVPLATANAIRIQNRLHNVKSPNFKNVKVLIANRTAILSGTVDSNDDAQFALRMVGLEPGVIEVKSELTVNGQAAK